VDTAPEPDADRRSERAAAGFALTRALGYPTNFLRDRVGFLDDANEWRRLFAEMLGTFFLVLVAVGAGMVNARFGGHAVSSTAQVAAPGLMVGAIILFMGSVSGAHLNPAVTLAFALRRDFPWKRVPGYVVAQVFGAVLAVLTLVALLQKQGTAGLTLPGSGISTTTAMLWEMLLTAGLVSTILGTSSGAQNVGPLNAIGVAGYIMLAGLWGAPVSGASMNVDRSLGPALVLNHWNAWWAYLIGPIGGALIGVGISWILRGPGGGFYGKRAAQGALGWLWQPGPIQYEPASSPEQANHVNSGGPPPAGSEGPTSS
jgi:aquaporin Z